MTAPAPYCFARAASRAVRMFLLAFAIAYLLPPAPALALTIITNLNIPSLTNVEQIVFSDGSVQTTAASNSTSTGTGTGAGFPLTNDSSAAFYSITNVNYFEAQDIRASNTVRARYGYFSNNVTAGGTLTGAGLDINGSGDISGGLTVHGDLDVIGSTYQTTVINLSTNVYIGTTTNYVTTTVYSTNVVYQYTYVGTNTYITNNVNIDTYVNVNGTWDGTNANWVALPGLYSDGPVADGTTNTATGVWDFSGADVTGLATEGTTNAYGINLDTSNFNLNLSTNDTDVQTAMETLDDLVIAPPTLTNYYTMSEVDNVLTNYGPLADTNWIGNGLVWDGNKLATGGSGVVTNLPESLVYDTDATYTATVAKAATALQAESLTAISNELARVSYYPAETNIISGAWTLDLRTNTYQAVVLSSNVTSWTVIGDTNGVTPIYLDVYGADTNTLTVNTNFVIYGSAGSTWTNSYMYLFGSYVKGVVMIGKGVPE